ncbi:hypothetical protein JVU11DRAFT_9447 [Chiua virens]|nr:hypothetical protein JVU11DRAFT_9447 [Chiua virens]
MSGSAGPSTPPTVFRVPVPVLPIYIPPDSYHAFRGTDTPLIIDNGASNLRFGFSTLGSKTVLTPHAVPNVIARFKERKYNQPMLLFGDAIDAESGAKGQAKTPWEGDVLLNFDALEHALDCAFIQLGIDASSVAHPVLMTERLGSPLHSRAQQSPFQTKHPVYGGRIDYLVQHGIDVCDTYFGWEGILSHAKRIPWGAQQTTEHLLKLIQLKYHNFPTRVTSTQAGWMLHNFCEFATDYSVTLRSLKIPSNLRASERIIQFPFTLPVVEEKTEEELARIAEKRKEQGKKLQEIAAKNRMEKLTQKETDLQYLLNLKEGRSENKRETHSSRKGSTTDAALQETIKKLEYDLKRARKKDVDGADEPVEEPNFNLVDVPDAELDEEGIKEKKKQKLMKAGWEARARARREKEKEREEKEAEEKRDEEERENNFEEWASRLRREQEALMSKMKERGRRKAALADRKSAAAQARMKNIASLAADDRVSKKKRKAGAEDMFGADDEDWAIYRKINTATASSDEEEDYNQLQIIESKLLQYDPTFTTQHTHASLTSQRSALLSVFRPQYEEGDIAGHSRIHLNTERWRVCETFFSPGMAGVDSAGVGEVLQSVLARFSEAEKRRLVKHVFLTGGPSQLPGLRDRVYDTLRPILPTDIEIGNLMRAADPMVDAWHGMAAFANTEEFKQVGITREEYDECGGERIKRWWAGNWNSAV